jgi:SAM-dependent methyltransferase
MSWRDFWTKDNPIYVSERHKALHFHRVAKDFIALIPFPEAHVLDYGSGESREAPLIARACGRLYLYDAIPAIVAALKQRFDGDQKIIPLDDAGLAALPSASLDMIFCNSVAQYMSDGELERLLHLWHQKLKPGGQLVLGDIIPPQASMPADVKALLTFAWQGGFFFAALLGLARTYFSDYRQLREEVGILTYAEDAMLDLLRAHGFAPRRAAQNIGHNQTRMTFIARAEPVA